MNMKKIEDYFVFEFENLSSTMDVAKEFLKKYEKVIILAKKQSEGRGRYGRKWFSPEGGLYFSFTLKKNETTNFLSEITSLSLIETFKYYGIKNCKIKFPNDIIINDKKICGILIEKSGDFYIVGVGVNVKKNENLKINNYIAMEDILNIDLKTEDILINFIYNFKKITELFRKNKEIGLKEWSENLIK
ncbi:MAG: biotin--[acetyl-CoA-carboxylase] ligase [Candidatus Omnitrophica bacterium]|nr:biotin--[acetyl-CoA-carboxylase] ligase [Candidatus Omnitrophota bacterium]